MTVERVYVINLEREVARREHSVRALAAAGFAPERVEVFPAVDARGLSVEGLTERGVTVYPHWRQPGSPVVYFNRDLKWGEIACSLSHLAVWRLIADGPHPVALVLEDDVLWPTPGAAAAVDRALASLASLEPAWHLCYVGRAAFDPKKKNPGFPRIERFDRPVAPGIIVPTFCYGGFAYALTRSGARQLLDGGLEKAVVPVDEYLPAQFYPHPREDVRALFGAGDRLKAFALEPRLARQDFGPPSTIESTPDVAP